MIGRKQVFHKFIIPLKSLQYLDLQTQPSLILAALILGNFSVSYLNAGPVWSIVLKKFFISWLAEEAAKYGWVSPAVSTVHSLFPAPVTLWKPTTLILAAWLGTRTRVGSNIHAAILLQQTFEAQRVTKEYECLLHYPWCNESKWKVTLFTITMFMVW
jgi:hypothetical protein